MFDISPEDCSGARGPQGNMRTDKNCLMRGFMIAFLRQILFRRKRWLGRVAHMEKKVNSYMVLVGKPEGKATWMT